MENEFTLIQVKNKQQAKLFLKTPLAIYQKKDKWIRPFDQDIESVFNPQKNKLFRKGDAIRWILKNDKGGVVGRIAAFYDEKTARKNDQPTGGCGFFECINDDMAASTLFDAAQNWLKSRGMEAMDGPVNFGPRDHFWGCLKEGFHEPVFNMPYNPPYYNRLFETYGFKDYYKQYTYHLPMRVGHIGQSIMDSGARLIDNKKYRFEFYNKRNAPQTVDNFLTVFNAAWANFPGVSKMRKQQGDALFKALKFIIDPKLFIFCFYENKPIAFFLMIPDLNQIIRSFNGKLNWFNKLRLFYKLKITKEVTRALGMIFGVVPEFQGKGIPAGMIKFFEHEVRKGTQYTDLEMNWIGEFNPKMLKLVEQLNASVWKTHITYRYLFDPQREFKRAKSI